jgi:hypothetical protein
LNFDAAETEDVRVDPLKFLFRLAVGRRISSHSWQSKNPTFTPRSGPPAMNCAAAWTSSCSCCSSNTSPIKYGDSDDFAPPVTIPKGASFKDMIVLKGSTDIGDKINTQVIQPLIDANSRLARGDFPARVEKLSNLAVISSFTLAPHYEGIAAHSCRRSHFETGPKIPVTRSENKVALSFQPHAGLPPLQPHVAMLML